MVLVIPGIEAADVFPELADLHPKARIGRGHRLEELMLCHGALVRLKAGVLRQDNDWPRSGTKASR